MSSDSRLSLSNRFYRTLFNSLDVNHTNSLHEKQAFQLFKTSNLSDDILKEIWDHIKILPQNETNYDGFIKAIKLISLSQMGCKFKLTPIHRIQYVYVPHESKPKINQLISRNDSFTVEHLKQNIVNKHGVPIDELFVCTVKNHKIQRIFDNEQLISDISEGDELFIYHSTKPELADDEKCEPFRIDHKYDGKYIGVPLIVSYPMRSDVPGSYLWGRLLTSLRLFIPTINNINQNCPFTFGSHWNNDNDSIPSLMNTSYTYATTGYRSIHFTVWWSDISAYDNSYDTEAVDEEKEDTIDALNVFNKYQNIPSPILKYSDNIEMYEDEQEILERDKNIINQIYLSSQQAINSKSVESVSVDDVLFNKHYATLNKWNETTNKLIEMKNAEQIDQSLYQKYQTLFQMIQEQQHRIQRSSTDEYVMQLMKQQSTLYQATVSTQSVITNKIDEITELNRQSETIQNRTANRYKTLQNVKQEYAEMVQTENTLKIELKNKKFTLNIDNEYLEQLQLSSKRCAELMEKYHKFINVNTNNIQTVTKTFKDLWNNFEKNWSQWNVQNIIEWFKYKTTRLDVKGVDFDSIEAEMNKQNVSGLSLPNIDINALYLLGIHNFQIRSDIFKCIQILITRYPIKEDQPNDDEKDESISTKKPSIPHKFLCPITKSIMKEPVIAFDGNTYEKSAIMEYLKQNKKSPITNQVACTMCLYPNIGLKQEIEFYQSAINTCKNVENEGDETYYID